MDLRLALMCGSDIPLPECKLTIHQPRIREISFIGETDFFQGIQCLCLNKTMFVKDESALSNISNFQIFMTIMTEKETLDKRFSVQQVCTLLFPNHKATFTPRSIILIGQNENIVIDENNFESLQEVLKLICCQNNGPMDQHTFNPGNAQAREIAEKLMRGRQRVAVQKGETNVSVFTQYLSTLAVGLHSMSLSDCMELTMYQLYDLIERYKLFINWDIDIRSRLAGAKIDKEPDNWMKNIH